MRIAIRVRARVTVWVKFKVGVRARIPFFLFACWHANKLCSFQMIGFYGLLAGNKARTEVLPLVVTTAQSIDQSVDSMLYRLSYCKKNFQNL